MIVPLLGLLDGRGGKEPVQHLEYTCFEDADI